MSKANYTPPDIASVAGYGKNQAPAAAKFNVGIRGRAGAEAAQNAVREHSNELTSRPIGPTTKINSIP